MSLPVSSLSPYCFFAGAAGRSADCARLPPFVKKVVIVNVPVTEVPGAIWNLPAGARYRRSAGQLQVADIDDSGQAAQPREEIENRVVRAVGLESKGISK